MNPSFPSASRRARRGVAAVEFAFVLPFLCFAFVAAVDFARVFYYSIAVSNCARNGALYASADTTHAVDSAGITDVAKYDAKKDFNSTELTQLGVSPSPNSSTSPTYPAGYVDVTVTYPFKTITHYPGIPASSTLSRTVRMPRRTAGLRPQTSSSRATTWGR